MKRTILTIVAVVAMICTIQAQKLVPVKNYGKNWPKTMISL